MNKRHEKKEPASPSRKRIASRSLLVVVLLALALVILFRILLITPFARDYLSQTLSRYTHHKVTVAGLTMAGQTIYLSGIVIENPPGFKNRKMITARTIALTPNICGLLRGKRSLYKLEIVGLGVIAEKTSGSRWNFSALLQQFTKKKEQPSGEIFIRHFSLEDASLQINGHTIEKIGLTLADFSTKGTTNSKLEISGKDAVGNPHRLTAEGHLGDNPAFHVTVNAPAVSLAPLQQYLPGKPPLHLEKAQGKLSLSANLHNRLLTVQAAVAVKQLYLFFPGGSLPVNGLLDFEAHYNVLADSAELTHADLMVKNLATIRAHGSVRRVSKDSDFTLQLAPDRIDLVSLLSLLPESMRREYSLSGEMSSRGFQLKGNRNKGITTANGDFSLRNVALAQSKQLILTGGAADFTLRKTAENWLLNGNIFTERTKNTPLIESAASPVSARFSPRFKPLRVDAPKIRAVLTGIPIRGSFRYLDTADVPLSLNCAARDVPLSALNGFLAKKLATTRLLSGKFTATAGLSGTSLQKFTGKATLDLSAATGTASKRTITIKKAAILSRVKNANGVFSGTGSLALSGGHLDSSPFGVKADFTLDNRQATLHNTLVTFGTTRLQAEKISGNLPTKASSTSKGQIPLFASLAGAQVSSGDVAASGISGRIDAQYHTAGHQHSLVGKADISVSSLTYRNQPLASCTTHLTADGSTVLAEIRGNSLGGKLSARVRTGFFPQNRKISFSASLLKQKLEKLAGLFPQKSTPRIAAGMADVLLSGTYTQQSGLDGNFTLAGQGISLKNSSGKTLTSGISATFESTLHGQTLTVKKGILNHAQGPSLRIGGKVEHVTSADRTGELSFTMPSTTINSLLDSFANALPRNLQEASCEGSCTLAGSIAIRGTSTRINGNLALESASLEIPSQKITAAGIEGNLPFSLEFPWQGARPGHEPLSYSRENYGKLLENNKRLSRSGNRISIGSIRFGAFETGTLSLFISASEGIMRFSPIEVNLYDGRLLGSGYLILKGTPEYGTNIILNDISLKQFCDSFPSIKGYITGRIDGILSLKNEKGSLKELTGFVNLWARTGKEEEMLVSKEFLQKLAGKKLRGFFFQNDRPYDNGVISAYLQHNYLTFETLDISHTNFLGMKDLSVSVAPVQNRIALDHLLGSIRDAAARGKGGGQEAAPVQTDLKWLE